MEDKNGNLFATKGRSSLKSCWRVPNHISCILFGLVRAGTIQRCQSSKGHCIITSLQKWPIWTHSLIHPPCQAWSGFPRPTHFKNGRFGPTHSPTHPVRLGQVSLDPPTPLTMTSFIVIEMGMGFL